MGILNLTEDSFSDGGKYLSHDQALLHIEQMIGAGVHIIDIGAESTRPGAMPISAETELGRILPVLRAIRSRYSIPISIDTQKASVAAACIDIGIEYINDVSALGHDPQMLSLLAKHSAIKVILMHRQGNPQTMQLNPQYQDVLADIYEFFAHKIELCTQGGIAKERIILDVGIGFGKNLAHNLTLLANLDYFHSLGCPLLLGASRKSFIAGIHPAPADQRLAGSLAAAAFAQQCQIDYLRVHDVFEHRQFVDVYTAICRHRKDF